MSASVVISTPLVDARHEHGFADEFVLDVRDPRHDLLLRVVDVDVIVEALLDDHVDVLVDRAVEDPAAMLPVVVREVGTTTEQSDAQGCLGDNHRGVLRPFRLSVSIRLDCSDVAEIAVDHDGSCAADEARQQVVANVERR